MTAVPEFRLWGKNEQAREVGKVQPVDSAPIVPSSYGPVHLLAPSLVTRTYFLCSGPPLFALEILVALSHSLLYCFPYYRVTTLSTAGKDEAVGISVLFYFINVHKRPSIWCRPLLSALPVFSILSVLVDQLGLDRVISTLFGITRHSRKAKHTGKQVARWPSIYIGSVRLLGWDKVMWQQWYIYIVWGTPTRCVAGWPIRLLPSKSF